MERRDHKPNLGERELDIMQVLWRHGEAAVAEVQAHLAASGVTVAYTTVQTLLNRLEAKEMVARRTVERAHRYRALAAEPAVVDSAIGRLAERFFSGSVERLATRLVESDLQPEQLDRLRALIDAHRVGRGE